MEQPPWGQKPPGPAEARIHDTIGELVEGTHEYSGNAYKGLVPTKGDQWR